jgi:hypothetical protein
MALGLVAITIDVRRAAAAIGISSIAIPLGILILLPTMQIYRGLSGIDSALFTMLCVMLFRQAAEEHRNWLSLTMLLCLAGFIGKTAFECTTGRTLFVSSSSSTRFVPVPLAHAIGAACGAAAAMRRR